MRRAIFRTGGPVWWSMLLRSRGCHRALHATNPVCALIAPINFSISILIHCACRLYQPCRLVWLQRSTFFPRIMLYSRPRLSPKPFVPIDTNTLMSVRRVNYTYCAVFVFQADARATSTRRRRCRTRAPRCGTGCSRNACPPPSCLPRSPTKSGATEPSSTQS